MQIKTSPRGPVRRPLAVVAVFAVAVLLGVCGGGNDAGTSASSTSDAPEGDTRLLWMGDSIAGVEGPALRAALTASGVEFRNASSDGGGTVVEGDEMSTRLAESTWQELEENLASFQPNV